MSVNIRFTERFKEECGYEAERNEEKRILESIRVHVGHLLATRKGSVLIDPDFGLPDPGESGCSGAHWMSTALAYLEQAEPRLFNMALQSLGYDSEFGFNTLKIDAQTQLNEVEISVSMTARIYDQGNVDVLTIDKLA